MTNPKELASLPARFSTFPRTQPPAHFVPDVVSVFRAHLASIGTGSLSKGLSSDAVMTMLRADLCKLGFEIEAAKTASAKLRRPVFLGRWSTFEAVRNRWIPSGLALWD
jgi:hypothetical protein